MPGSDFRNLMAQSESSGNYGILTDAGGGDMVAGAYQFGDDRIEDFMAATGEKFTREEFLASPELQERAMNWHEQDVVDYVMEKGLDRFFGQEIKGVPVDMSAVVGMAHLGGRKGMRDFLESGGELDKKDKFGTFISDYGRKFSGQSLYNETPPRPRMRPQGLLPPETSPRPMARPTGLLG